MKIIEKINALKNHNGAMKYLINTSWVFSEKIIRMFIGFFVTIWVARYLGPEQYGVFSYAQSFVALFAVIATFGLDSIVVRELVKFEKQRNIILGTAFFLKLFGSFFVILLLAIAVGFTSNKADVNILIFLIASATILQSFNIIDFYFQSKILSKFVVFTNTTTLLFSSIFKVYLILNNSPLIMFAWVVLFDSVIVAAGLLYFYTRQGLSPRAWCFDFSMAQKLLSDSWPLIIAGMSFVIFSNIDNVMINEMLGSYEVGLYSAAYKLVTLWYFLPGLVLNSLLPAMINVKDNRDLFYQRLQMIGSLLIWVALFLALFYSFFGEYLIESAFGAEYVNSIAILTTLVWVNILIFYNSVWNQWMMIENKTRRVLVFHLLTGGLNVLFNFIFIREFGVVGAAYALLGSLLVSYIIHFIFYKHMLIMFVRSVTFGRVKLGVMKV